MTPSCLFSLESSAPLTCAPCGSSTIKLPLCVYGNIGKWAAQFSAQQPGQFLWPLDHTQLGKRTSVMKRELYRVNTKVAQMESCSGQPVGETGTWGGGGRSKGVRGGFLHSTRVCPNAYRQASRFQSSWAPEVLSLGCSSRGSCAGSSAPPLRQTFFCFLFFYFS